MMHKSSIKRFAFTPGEAAGIGPDLAIQFIQKAHDFETVIIADPDMLVRRAKLLKLPLQIQLFDPDKPAIAQVAHHVSVMPVELKQVEQPNQLNVKNAQYILDTLKLAASGCQTQLFDAMVTGPIHKGIINDAGISFSGHTEYLAELTHGQPVMMLSTTGLRVALATTHLPLSQVSQAITSKLLENIITTLNHDLSHRFGIKNPNILVCGLNPHAGEDGHLGHEEIETIIPLLNSLREKGIQLQGPLPADTLFTPKYLEKADAVLAMYHDQGLPVLKHMGFEQTVNITLGLPIIRTSVGHGTALDLAGTGKANISSLNEAFKVANEMT